jgi:hypothetical protein
VSKHPNKALQLVAGDTVLIGTPGVSMPSHWWHATVIYVAGDEIATEHTPPSNSRPQRQFLPITDVRAVGSYAFLREFQETATKAVGDLSKGVDDATQALGRARDAVWAKLDEIAAAAPGVGR